MAKTFLDLQNLRASKINESTAAKILDVDLARFYNEVISDMSKYGTTLKKVTTNIVANQSEYTNSVLPGLIATALVKIGDQIAPFIEMEDYAYSSDRSVYCHTLINGSLSLLPIPTAAVTNGLVVWYWAKLPEIIDAAIAATSLGDLNDKDWNVVIDGVSLKMYEKLLAIVAVSSEKLPDGSIDSIVKVVDYFSKKYATDLDNLGSQEKFFSNSKNTLGPAARENDMPAGVGRQDK